jgi:type VI secretion system protein ImpL
VLLALRLARDGAAAPRPEPGQPAMTVAERTVIYRFDDPWALFSMIAAQRQPGAPGADERATLLRFEFPITHEGAAALAQADARARVFLRLSVSAPGKRTPLAWPTVFPTQVPAWQELAGTGIGAEANGKPAQASTND